MRSTVAPRLYCTVRYCRGATVRLVLVPVLCYSHCSVPYRISTVPHRYEYSYCTCVHTRTVPVLSCGTINQSIFTHIRTRDADGPSKSSFLRSMHSCGTSTIKPILAFIQVSELYQSIGTQTRYSYGTVPYCTHTVLILFRADPRR